MNLDRRIELHEPTTSRNNSGQYLTSYALHSVVSAALNPSYANKDNSGWQMYGYQVFRFVIRYNPTVKHTWRVIHNAEEFEITGILPDGRRTYQTLICKLRENDQ